MQSHTEQDFSDTGSETSSSSEGATADAATPPSLAFINDKSKRLASFKKQKAGLMRRAYNLSTRTGTQVLVLAVSENGLVYTFTTDGLKPLVTQPEGKNLIQTCLNTSTRVSPSSTASTFNSPSQAPNNEAAAAAGSRILGPDALYPIDGIGSGTAYAVDESASNKQYARSERFWLLDGNIILSTRISDTPQSADPPHFILFRVHKSVLARQSEIFEHMLGATFSPDVEGAVNEMYDGLPVVEMPDSREQVTSLLEVLYGGISLPYKHFDPRAGETARLVLEIAAKYEMNDIQQRVIAHIEDYWPASLATWDILEARLQLIRNAERREDQMDCYAQEPAVAIVLARRFGIRYILSAAFYDLSRISASCDLTARESRVEDAPDDEVDNDTWNVRAARWSALSGADYHRVCVARERLRAKAVLAIGRALHACPAEGCLSAHRCREQSIYAQAETRGSCYSSYDMLKALKEAADTIAMCSLCRDGIRDKLQVCRLEIWRDLPVIFSL